MMVVVVTGLPEEGSLAQGVVSLQNATFFCVAIKVDAHSQMQH